MRRIFHLSVLIILVLTGCVPDNNKNVQISITGMEDSYDEVKTQAPRSRSVSSLITDKTGNHSELDIPAAKSVDPWENKYGPGVRLTTIHYRIYTTMLDPERLRRIPGFMESAYKAYKDHLLEYIEPQTGLTIYLFENRQQWEAFTKDYAGDQALTFCKIKSGAYYHDGVCVAYDIGPAKTLSVLGHEGWHQFSDKHFKYRMPSWLDEGVAMLFETNDLESGNFKLKPDKNHYRLRSLKKTIESDSMISLTELIASNPGDVLAMDRTEAVTAFYSQSYALVRFLREFDSCRRLNIYNRLLADGLHGRWHLDEPSIEIASNRSIPRNVLWNHMVGMVLFEDYVGDDYDRIEKEYLSFCKKIVEREK